MNKFTLKRLTDLEKVLVQHEDRPWHKVVVDEDEDADARIAALIASGQAREGDKFIVRRFISPRRSEDATEAFARMIRGD